MDRVDEFESLFRSADKPQFEYRELKMERVALVTDLDAAGTAELERAVRSFLEPLPGIADATLACIAGDDFDNADTLLGKLGDFGADLVVSYRNVRGSDRSGHSTLGSYIHILSQETAVPLLLLPDPESPQFRERLASDGPVMVMTDALTGDSTLINSGLLFCREGGSLYLSHIESGPIFERYMEVISKIPDLNTDLARESIERQLLKEPADFIESCRGQLAAREIGVKVHPVVRLGHRLRDYEDLIEEHGLRLLVMPDSHPNQLAMNPVTYPIAVEFRNFPLLLV